MNSQQIIERALEIRKELFDLANKLAGNKNGDAAVLLHGACNQIIWAKEAAEGKL